MKHLLIVKRFEPPFTGLLRSLTAMRHKPRLWPMKMRSNPTEITLKDLPLEGRDFEYSDRSGELTQALVDLIGPNPYEVTFRLAPVGNAYSLQGKIKTSLNLQCSICASDFQFPVVQNLNELIVVESPMNKGDQQSRANHVHELQDSGPDYLILSSEVFKVADYIHEMVGLAEPIRPLCAPELTDGCAQAKERPQREWLSYGDGGKIQANPFQILEKMKLKG